MPDNRTVAVGVDTGRLLFIDVVAATLTGQLGDGRSHVCQSFSVDARGNYAALVTADGCVRLHDLAVMRKNTLASDQLARCVETHTGWWGGGGGCYGWVPGRAHVRVEG
jgi:hypothetical protein